MLATARFAEVRFAEARLVIWDCGRLFEDLRFEDLMSEDLRFIDQ
jgi:hypothetical protein